MTTLILAYKKTGIFFPGYPVLREWFGKANRRGTVSALILLFILSGVVFYTAGVYYIFDLGFGAQKQTKTLKSLEDEVWGKELTLQQSLARLADERKDIIQSMEKVSSIQYLEPINFVLLDQASTP